MFTTISRTKKSFYALSWYFFSLGIILGTFSSSIPIIKDEQNIHNDMLGVALMISIFGSFSSLLFVHYIKKYGSNFFLFLINLLLLILYSFLGIKNIYSFYILIFFYGFFLSLITFSLYLQLLIYNKSLKKSSSNMFYLINSFGIIIGAFFSGCLYYFNSTLSVLSHNLILSLLLLTPSLLFYSWLYTLDEENLLMNSSAIKDLSSVYEKLESIDVPFLLASVASSSNNGTGSNNSSFNSSFSFEALRENIISLDHTIDSLYSFQSSASNSLYKKLVNDDDSSSFNTPPSPSPTDNPISFMSPSTTMTPIHLNISLLHSSSNVPPSHPSPSISESPSISPSFFRPSSIENYNDASWKVFDNKKHVEINYLTLGSLLILSFVSSFSISTIMNWSTLFFREEFNLDKFIRNFSIIFFYLGIITNILCLKLIFNFFINNIKRIFQLSLFLTFIGLIGITSASDINPKHYDSNSTNSYQNILSICLACFGFFLSGFGLSILNPIIYVIAENELDGLSVEHCYMMLNFSSLIGSFLSPVIFGFLSTIFHSLRWSYIVVSGLICLLFFYITFFLSKLSPSNPKIPRQSDTGKY